MTNEEKLRCIIVFGDLNNGIEDMANPIGYGIFTFPYMDTRQVYVFQLNLVTHEYIRYATSDGYHSYSSDNNTRAMSLMLLSNY